MNAVAFIPGILAVIWLLRKSHREAYLDIYLPSVLLLPGWCRCVLPGAPDPTFHEAAILPIAGAFFYRGFKNWRFSPTDFLVLAYTLIIGYSEYRNAGFSDAQNLMFDMIAAGLLPYMLAKGIVEANGLRVAFVRRFTWLMAILAWILTYEFKFAYNPYRRVFDTFFPGQGDGWVTTFRYGFARIAGPFGHAILAGIVFMIAYRLQRWLEHSGHWEPHFRSLRTRFTKAQMLTASILGGIVMTMVRGPQIGSVIATVVSFMGRGTNPKRRALIVTGLLLAIGIPVAIAAYGYAAVGRAAALTASQESAAYRKELIDKYVGIALEHSMFGWGRNGWPKVSGMPSIDNYYLLLALMHGVPVVLLLIAILVSLFVRLMRNGFRSAPMKPSGSSLSFTLAGIFAGFIFSILTVYMGDNVIPIFFTIVGFSEGYLQAGGDASDRRRNAGIAGGVGITVTSTTQPRFAHVLA